MTPGIEKHIGPPSDGEAASMPRSDTRAIDLDTLPQHSDLLRVDTITLADLEVWYQIGVPDEERARPQRLHLTIQLHLDVRPAAAHDDLSATINYFALSQRLLAFGHGRSWKLVETLATDKAKFVLHRVDAGGRQLI